LKVVATFLFNTQPNKLTNLYDSQSSEVLLAAPGKNSRCLFGSQEKDGRNRKWVQVQVWWVRGAVSPERQSHPTPTSTHLRDKLCYLSKFALGN